MPRTLDIRSLGQALQKGRTMTIATLCLVMIALGFTQQNNYCEDELYSITFIMNNIASIAIEIRDGEYMHSSAKAMSGQHSTGEMIEIYGMGNTMRFATLCVEFGFDMALHADGYDMDADDLLEQVVLSCM
jgi:hypothetical protein